MLWTSKCLYYRPIMYYLCKTTKYNNVPSFTAITNARRRRRSVSTKNCCSMFPQWHHAVPESAYFKVPETLKTVRMYPTSRFVYVLYWLAIEFLYTLRVRPWAVPKKSRHVVYGAILFPRLLLLSGQNYGVLCLWMQKRSERDLRCTYRCKYT